MCVFVVFASGSQESLRLAAGQAASRQSLVCGKKTMTVCGVVEAGRDLFVTCHLSRVCPTRHLASCSQEGRIQEAQEMFESTVVENILVKGTPGNSEVQTLHASEVQKAFAASSLVLYASFVHQVQDNAPEAICLLQRALVSCLRVCSHA